MAIKVILILTFVFFLVALSLPAQSNTPGSVYAFYNGPCGTNRVVAPGDTFSEITEKCQVSMDALLAANPSLGPNSQLEIGQRVYMPKSTVRINTANSTGAEIIPNTGSSAPVSIPITGETTIHTDPYVIQPGDTLSKLALRFNTSVEELLILNPSISNPNQILYGHTLNVP